MATPALYSNRYPQMVHEYFVRRVRAAMAARQERLARLRTRRDARNYVRAVRDLAAQSFRPYFPKIKCPLAARVTGRADYPKFALEKIVFQSRPDFYVTANLYLPLKLDVQAPAVLGLCGHALNGKQAAPYYSFAQGLASKGFVCLLMDPISQGERWQHDRPRGTPMPGLCHAHNLLGNQMVLADDFFGAWRVYDAIRGLDYLLSRPEVDPARVGVTGNSGGGTLSAYLTALDSRLTMAAPSCYICSWQAQVENEIPADAEQNPPGILARGLDEADLLIAYAPRPTIVLGQYYDFFDCRYTQAAYRELQRVHELLGSPDTAQCFIGPTTHGYSIHNREAMYRFFMQHAGLSGSAREPRITTLSETDTNVLLRRKNDRLPGRRVFEFTRDRAAGLAARRGRPVGRRLQHAVLKVLGIALATEPPHYRVTPRYIQFRPELKMRGQFLAETAPGILSALTVCGGPEQHPRHLPIGRLIAYIGHLAGEADLLADPAARALLRGKRTVVAIDPRGIGQSEPLTCGERNFLAPYRADYLYASLHEMFGENYLGARVYDVLRALDLLYAAGATEIELAGRGLGSVTAAFAALLHPRRPRARLWHYLPGYQMLAEAQYYIWPLSAMPRGVLRYFDLPDVYRALGRCLRKSAPWDACMRPPR